MIGFPALAASSMDQPIGIYTITEVSYCGATEEELTRSSVPYEVGVSRYRELARGQGSRRFQYGMITLKAISTTARSPVY